MSNNPYETPPAFEDGGLGGPNTQAMLAKVGPPAIGLIVVGVLNILFSLYGIGNSALFMAGMHPAAATQQAQLDEMIERGGQEGEFAATMLQVMQGLQGPVGLGTNLLSLVLACIIIAGALKMKKLQSYGFSLTAAILAMIPCLSNCCLVGLPIGIWATVVLMDSSVKQSFSRG